jgi:Transposase IS116/IS110/IS902 family
MAYLGLVPSESISSDKRRQGAITKTGNSHARWILIECAQHYAMLPKNYATLPKKNCVYRPGSTGQLAYLSRTNRRVHTRPLERGTRLRERGTRLRLSSLT